MENYYREGYVWWMKDMDRLINSKSSVYVFKPNYRSPLLSVESLQLITMNTC